MGCVIGRIHCGLKVVFCFKTFYCLPLSSSYKTAHGHWPHVNVCRVSCGGVVNMLLVLSITFYFPYNIWGCRCSTGPFQYRWLKRYSYSSCYNHHQIGSIHLSHCYLIFFRGCVSEMFVTSYSVTYCIYIPGKPGICFHYHCAVCVSANGRIRFDLKIIFVYLYITPSHYHHCASLSEDIELIKCLSDMVCRVCE